MAQSKKFNAIRWEFGKSKSPTILRIFQTDLSDNYFPATYKKRSSRRSLLNLCTQSRNRCRPLKLVSPSTAMNSAFLFPRASRQNKEIPAADSVVSRAQISCKPARSSNFSFSPGREKVTTDRATHCDFLVRDHSAHDQRIAEQQPAARF